MYIEHGMLFFIASFLFSVLVFCIYLFADTDKGAKFSGISLTFIFGSITLYLGLNIQNYYSKPWKVEGEVIAEIKDVYVEYRVTRQTLLFIYKDKPYAIDVNKYYGGVVDTQPFDKKLDKVRVTFWETQYGVFSTKQEPTLELINE